MASEYLGQGVCSDKHGAGARRPGTRVGRESTSHMVHIKSLSSSGFNFFICPMSEDAHNAQCPPVREVRATLGNIRGRDLNMEILGGKIYICFTEW